MVVYENMKIIHCTMKKMDLMAFRKSSKNGAAYDFCGSIQPLYDSTNSIFCQIILVLYSFVHLWPFLHLLVGGPAIVKTWLLAV